MTLREKDTDGEIIRQEQFLKKEELFRIPEDLFEKVVLLVVAALGLISALAWDKVLKSVFERIFSDIETLNGQFLYAVVTTVIAALVSVVLGKRVIKRRKKSK